MKKFRHVLIMLCALYSAPSYSDQPSINIGIDLFDYPELVVVPGYPVYYAPRMESNYFFYDGEYWVYEDDNWYESSWYNGPWWLVYPEFVPVFILRVPVRYYRLPPAYFQGWRYDAPPRWGDHWGHDWEQHRSGWDKWNRNVHRKPAPLPDYQRQYSGDLYPRQVERQHELQQQNYRYRSRDPIVQQRHQRQAVNAPDQQERKLAPQPDRRRSTPRQQGDTSTPRTPSAQRGGVTDRRADPVSPQHGYPAAQEHRQQPQPGADQREQQMQRSQDRETRQQGNDAERAPNHGQGQEQEHGRDR